MRRSSFIKIIFRCDTCQTPFNVDEAMAGKKSNCPECGEKLLVPDESEKVAPVDINPRIGDVFELIESINSVDFCRDSLSRMVQKFNNLVDTIKLKNMQIEARDNITMKLQAELWEHEAARCELADDTRAIKNENRMLRKELTALRKAVGNGGALPASTAVSSESQVEHVDRKEFDRLKNIKKAQTDQFNALLSQVDAQNEELQQLRLGHVESQEKRERLCGEISRLNHMIAEMSSRQAKPSKGRSRKVAVA